MLADVTKPWSITLAAAIAAVALALAGLAAPSLMPAAPPALMAAVLGASLVCTVLAFGTLAVRVRRLELENSGLVEEISQEFDRVRDKLEIFSDALAEPRTLTPTEEGGAPLRRVTVR